MELFLFSLLFAVALLRRLPREVQSHATTRCHRPPLVTAEQINAKRIFPWSRPGWLRVTANRQRDVAMVPKIARPVPIPLTCACARLQSAVIGRANRARFLPRGTTTDGTVDEERLRHEAEKRRLLYDVNNMQTADVLHSSTRTRPRRRWPDWFTLCTPRCEKED